ncbi:hypothetical protein [Nonomuraea diastatica]|uniref:Uncharacterized protein n=1 Tax=Nonomuraea diastatica TaxID=1848329 RepID=A0A4V2YFT6_9ACTN|nr:hypothetical protein [Nonomuraea diastatica]TDD24467.1 hypothetical protein E1294_05760 [Nonomuraea diastatica]
MTLLIGKFQASVAAALVAAAALTAPPASATPLPGTPELTASASCSIADHAQTIADHYISKCRKAGIRKVFPAQYLPKTIYTIKRDKSRPGKTAWKLLNANRWKKYQG